jgi:GNAT superfamily N-acetyltransferase
VSVSDTALTSTGHLRHNSLAKDIPSEFPFLIIHEDPPAVKELSLFVLIDLKTISTLKLFAFEEWPKISFFSDRAEMDEHMGYVIRSTLNDDITLLTGLIRTAFRDVAERFNLTSENCPTHPSNCTTGWIESALKKGIKYYILENKNIPAGCVALERAQSGVFYLERLSVLPQFRRNGFGEALVNHAVNDAKKMGARRIEIGIISDHTELCEWYKKIGFSVKNETRFEHLPFKVTFMSKEL